MLQTWTLYYSNEIGEPSVTPCAEEWSLTTFLNTEIFDRGNWTSTDSKSVYLKFTLRKSISKSLKSRDIGWSLTVGRRVQKSVVFGIQYAAYTNLDRSPIWIQSSPCLVTCRTSFFKHFHKLWTVGEFKNTSSKSDWFKIFSWKLMSSMNIFEIQENHDYS